MGLIRCKKGLHYFDDEKYGTCPYCGIFEDDDMVTIAVRDMQTVMEKQSSINDDGVTISFSEDIDADDVKTIGIYSKNRGNDYVVGWMVCVEGADVGRDFRLYQGRNFLGRDYSMDICIENDMAISRKNHCAIVYDERSNIFFITPMENLVYVENMLLSGVVELVAGQEILIGNSKFVFIPFCEGERKWKREK